MQFKHEHSSRRSMAVFKYKEVGDLDADGYEVENESTISSDTLLDCEEPKKKNTSGLSALLWTLNIIFFAIIVSARVYSKVHKKANLGNTRDTNFGGFY